MWLYLANGILLDPGYLAPKQFSEMAENSDDFTCACACVEFHFHFIGLSYACVFACACACVASDAASSFQTNHVVY